MRSGPGLIKNSLLDRGSGRRAFTLVELLIAMLISALVLNSALLLAFRTMNSQKTAAELSKNFQEAAEVLGLMTKEIRAADAISPSSTGLKAVLISGPDLITYEFLSGKIKRSKNASGQYITTDGALDLARFGYPFPGTAYVEIKPAGISSVLTAEAFCRNSL
jgi:prepilin-type N-terminal cleavage/methylation domain-containing protein